MKHYVSGCPPEIRLRLTEVGKGTNVTIIQFGDSVDGWKPFSVWEYWPVCPGIGDEFAMKGLDATLEEDISDMHWKVIGRRLLWSEYYAKEISGIVVLTVERTDAPPGKEPTAP